MELIDKQKLLEAIERKRLDYIDADEDYEADVLEIWMDEIESGKFDHSAQEEIPGWEEIAGIQEAKAVQAEQETARLRDKLKQIDGQRMQTEQERCYFKKKAETYIEDIAWLEGKVSELEARAIQAEREIAKWKEKEFAACSKHHEYNEEIEKMEQERDKLRERLEVAEQAAEIVSAKADARVIRAEQERNALLEGLKEVEFHANKATITSAEGGQAFVAHVLSVVHSILAKYEGKP